MQDLNLKIKPGALKAHQIVEKFSNSMIRSFDKYMEKLHLGGKKSNYDDYHYEFTGGAKDDLRKKHYDKSLRLLWKAEEHAPWSSFKDCSKDELALLKSAKETLSAEEIKELNRMSTDEYREFLKSTYSLKEREAIVHILSLIGHGEAYAWMVSTELLNEVKSTGGRAALTMQVLEEAKHFVVLRELIKTFEIDIPRLSAWEYLFLERSFKSKGLEKFFSMNVLVEGFALSLFGMMSHLPGLEILRLFHLDESRHSSLPYNYFKEFPMTYWEMHNPVKKFHRMSLVLPAIPILIQIEPYLATLGIDSFKFGGSLARKLINLAERVGFYFPMSGQSFGQFLNTVFNFYCRLAREEHTFTNYLISETTVGEEELQIEEDVFKLETIGKSVSEGSGRIKTLKIITLALSVGYLSWKILNKKKN